MRYTIRKQHSVFVWPLQFLYDVGGQLYGFLYNGTPYYYVFNGQGDVVQVVDAAGTTKVIYTYDAWGKQLSQKTPEDYEIPTYATTDIANINPIRYRGYYYDAETGFYYLQSRYYDSEVGRFINGDGQINADMTGGNLFAYCGNNPVMFVDPSGDCYKCPNNYFGHRDRAATRLGYNEMDVVLDFIENYNFEEGTCFSDEIINMILAYYKAYKNGPERGVHSLGYNYQALAHDIRDKRTPSAPRVFGQQQVEKSLRIYFIPDSLSIEERIWGFLESGVSSGVRAVISAPYKQKFAKMAMMSPSTLSPVKTFAKGFAFGLVKELIRQTGIVVVWEEVPSS